MRYFVKNVLESKLVKGHPRFLLDMYTYKHTFSSKLDEHIRAETCPCKISMWKNVFICIDKLFDQMPSYTIHFFFFKFITSYFLV